MEEDRFEPDGAKHDLNVSMDEIKSDEDVIQEALNPSITIHGSCLYGSEDHPIHPRKSLMRTCEH
jgi:hypothetical protein